MNKAVYKYTLKRRKVMELTDHSNMSSPEQVVALLRAIGLDTEEQEHLVSIMLDAKNHVRGYATVAIGTVDNVMADNREIYRSALINGSTSIILAHNHPSGNVEPSARDIAITDKCKEAGEIIGIELIEHIIVGEDDYFSFVEEELL